MRLFGRADERVGFSVRSIYEGHLKATYRGVPALKSPFDYLLYQMLVSEVRPELIVEIGTKDGGGALYLADLLETIGGRGEVHAIDLQPPASALVLSHPRIRFFGGGYQGYDLAEARGRQRVLVIEDSTHTAADSFAALRKFAPLVTVGSYFIVEDGVVTRLGMARRFGGGPLEAIRAFLAENPDFAVDRRWCDFFGKNATFNVNGYLRRLR